MRTLCVVLTAVALATPCYARHASPLTYTPQGAALRTTRAPSSHWAEHPATHTLGSYHTSSAVPTGHSTARMDHVQRLHACNPFANVRATQPLAPC